MLEVLFAVLILGIGLILIAAIFPAAVRQTRASVDETKAASHSVKSPCCFAMKDIRPPRLRVGHLLQ
jgi:hypothetical protein